MSYREYPREWDMTRRDFESWMRTRYWALKTFTAFNGREYGYAECELCGRTASVPRRKVPRLFPFAEHFEVVHVLIHRDVDAPREGGEA